MIAKELRVSLSRGHLSKDAPFARHLRQAGPPLRAMPLNRRRRERRFAHCADLAAHRAHREVVLFADEIDVHKNPRIGRDWTLPGTQCFVETPGRNEKRYLAGAYDHARQRLIYVEGEQKARLALRSLAVAPGSDLSRDAEDPTLILDNYVIHKSQWVVKALAQLADRIVLHFLPPYCPQENRIERLWKDVPRQRHPQPRQEDHDRCARGHLPMPQQSTQDPARAARLLLTWHCRIMQGDLAWREGRSEKRARCTGRPR
ncbi:MAG: transposase [Candidatus Eisenbacteria bacterium]|nr:transposase [Candidatus Eisenbacteria bacterium]